MIPVLSQLLSDNESLLEYERLEGSIAGVSMESICRRLIAKERLLSPQKSDMYYEGLYSMYLSNYRSFSELIWKVSVHFSPRLPEKLELPLRMNQ